MWLVGLVLTILLYDRVFIVILAILLHNKVFIVVLTVLLCDKSLIVVGVMFEDLYTGFLTPLAAQFITGRAFGGYCLCT